MIVFGNWLGEFTDTIGNGDLNLTGSIPGFALLSSAGEGQFYYCIQDGNDRETGLGDLANGVLKRTNITATLVNGTYVTHGAPLELSGNAMVFGVVNDAMMRKFFELQTIVTDINNHIGNIASITINGHSLGGNVDLTASDVGARDSSWLPTPADIGVYTKEQSDGKYVFQGVTINNKNLAGNITITADDVNAYDKAQSDAKFVPQIRTINGNPLSADVVLDAAAVGARASGWIPSAEDIGVYTKGQADAKYALQSVTINGHPLSANIVLTAADLGVVVDGGGGGTVVTGVSSVNGKSGVVTITLAELAGMPLAGGSFTGGIVVPDYIRLSGAGTVYFQPGGKMVYTMPDFTNRNAMVIADASITFGNTVTPLILESSANVKFKIGSNEYIAYHTGNKPTAADVGAVPDSIMAANQNLDELKVTGVYSQTNDHIASGLGYPADVVAAGASAVVIVTKVGASAYVIQELICTATTGDASHSLYSRVFNGTSWSDWAKTGTSAEASGGNIPVALVAGQNIDNLKTPGDYYGDPNNTMIMGKLPSEAQGECIAFTVKKSGDDNWVQLCYTTSGNQNTSVNANGSFIRHYTKTAGKWSNWTKFINA